MITYNMELEFLSVLRAEPTWTFYQKIELVKGILQEGEEELRFLKNMDQDHSLLLFLTFPV